MGLSSQKTTSGPSAFAKPFISSAANEISDVYNQNKDANAGIAKTIQDLIPGLVNKYNDGDPNVSAATGYNTDVLSGKYLNGNPFLESIISKTSNDTLGKVGAAFGSRGAFGGTKYAEAAGRGVADSENALRYGDYNTQLGRMDTAASRSPSLAAADYLGITPLLATAQAGTELPFSAVNDYGSLIASLLGNSTTTKQSGNILQSLIGAAGTAAGGALAASDRRLKTNIRKVGEFADGLNIYEFEYVDPPTEKLREYMPDGQFVGVMAQEIARIRPWALGPTVHGFMTVRYDLL